MIAKKEWNKNKRRCNLAMDKASTCHPERRKDKKKGKEGGIEPVPDVDSKKDWNKNK